MSNTKFKVVDGVSIFLQNNLTDGFDRNKGGISGRSEKWPAKLLPFVNGKIEFVILYTVHRVWSAFCKKHRHQYPYLIQVNS
jgi:hypothetical protein